MRLYGLVKPILIGFSIFCFSNLFAQLSADDSVLYQKAVNNAVILYHHSSGDQSGLYNGSQYVGYPLTIKEGHPFFNTDSLSSGTIVYDNVFYPEVYLLYDEVADLIIFQDASHRIQLLSDRISKFSILDNHFIRIEKDSLNHSLVSTGFYNLLYEGTLSVLKKEVKTIHEEIRNNSERVLRYEMKEYYYIKKNNEYYPIKRKSDVLKLFKNRKNDIQPFMKSNMLNFRKDPDRMLIKLTAYYDQLTT